VNSAPAIRALIADDEPLARQRVRQFLGAEQGLRVVGESHDGAEAVRDILRLRPDLVFLDIQMPGLTGFEVIDTVGLERMPVVVFVTAFDRYALNAFDVHAVDYLLKPYSRERFRAALESAVRAIRSRRMAGHAAGLNELIASLGEDGRLEPHILVRAGGRLTVVKVADIDWVEAAGNYVELHVGNHRHLVRSSMKSMTRRLDVRTFVRIHRSTILNVERIKELRQLRTGDYDVLLKDGRKLTLSRRFKAGLEHLLASR
jgi:two-component system LytT family response regulator